MPSSNYDIMDGESPNKFIEVNVEVINREGMIIMAGEITFHFHFVCLEAFSLKVFINCQNMFDLFCSFSPCLEDIC